MKKFILLVIISLIGTNSSSQKKEKFKLGVKLEENTIITDFKSANSILFIFKDDTHMINFYLDLTKRLKKRFNKSNQKIDFNFELYSDNPFESDLNSNPNGNFGNLLFLWDIIFGTAKITRKYPKKFGAWNQVKEAWYIQLLFPLVRSKDSNSELHSIITKNDYDPSTLNKKFNS